MKKPKTNIFTDDRPVDVRRPVADPRLQARYVEAAERQAEAIGRLADAMMRQTVLTEKAYVKMAKLLDKMEKRLK